MKKMNAFFDVFNNALKRKLKSKYFLLTSILFLMSFVIFSSYAVFMISTGGFRSSELFVAKLLYGVSVTEAIDTNATVTNNVVLVPANSKAYLYVNINSLNPVDSKYQLAYSTNNSSVNVYYSSKTSWKPQGLIDKDGSSVDEKDVRIVVENNTNSSSQITFQVYGGYTFNNYTAINLASGYIKVEDVYDEQVAFTDATKLTEVVESDNSCATTSNNPCLYGGDAINNYVQYPVNSDKSKNIWRIMGTYSVDGKVVAKLISETSTTSTYTNAVSGLSNFYSTLDNKDDYLYSTDKFLCTGSNLACASSSKFSNIGLINVDEYNKIGGLNSYLGSSSSYFSMTEVGSLVSNITSGGIQNVSFATSSGLRGVVYVQEDVKVLGSGTISDPYIFEERGDVNIIAYTYYGESGVLDSFPSQSDPYIVDSVTCTNGTTATWDNAKWELNLKNVNVPTYCTIDFKAGYKVTMSAVNGTVSPTNQAVGYNGTATFTGTPNTNYTTTGATVSCNNGATGTVSGSTITVKNVVSDTSCTVTYPSDSINLYAQILEDNPNVRTRSSFSSIFTTSNNGNTIYRATGQGNKTTYYFAGTVTNNYVKFANKYWRIVRINEDNSVRLIYAGTSASDTAAFISTSQAYNSSSDNSAYVGYMYTASQQYGTGTNSSIKTVVDNWYASNLNSYSGYISKTAIYCNDRTVGSGTWSATGDSFDYAADTRLSTNKTPTFTCSNANDRFTASTSTGNGKLTYPIGLITMDEVYYAGGYIANNTSYYIAQNASSGANYWWTMSPNDWDGGISHALVFVVGGSSSAGSLNSIGVVGTFGVRPVISLKSCVLASGGSGTASDPYTVELPSACSSAAN